MESYSVGASFTKVCSRRMSSEGGSKDRSRRRVVVHRFSESPSNTRLFPSEPHHSCNTSRTLLPQSFRRATLFLQHSHIPSTSLYKRTTPGHCHVTSTSRSHIIPPTKPDHFHIPSSKRSHHSSNTARERLSHVYNKASLTHLDSGTWEEHPVSWVNRVKVILKRLVRGVISDQCHIIQSPAVQVVRVHCGPPPDTHVTLPIPLWHW